MLTVNCSKINNTVGTPRDLVKWMENHFNFQFDFDCCPENSIIDNLRPDVHWGTYNFCNPPYSDKRSGIKQFLERAIVEKNNNKTTIMLIPNNSNTKYYNDIMNNCHSIIYLKPIIFIGYDKPFPKGLIIVEINNKPKNTLHKITVDVLGKQCPKLYWE